MGGGGGGGGLGAPDRADTHLILGRTLVDNALRPQQKQLVCHVRRLEEHEARASHAFAPVVL